MTNLLLLGFLPSGSEWIIIALVILLLFGGKKIPELMRGLGKGVKSFKAFHSFFNFPHKADQLDALFPSSLDGTHFLICFSGMFMVAPQKPLSTNHEPIVPARYP